MSLARRAIRLYPRTDYNNRKTVNHLRREWIRSVRQLGDKWIIATANRIQRHADKAVMLACVVSAFPWEWL